MVQIQLRIQSIISRSAQIIWVIGAVRDRELHYFISILLI